MQRRVYRLRAGALSNLRLETETLSPPGPEEVRVAVRTVGLNFADIFAIWGLYGATPKGEFTPGLEYAGEILEAGPAVKPYQSGPHKGEIPRPGDRVMGVTRFGAYATHLHIDSRYLLPIPESWSFEQGAGYLVQVLTAYYGLKTLGELEKGQTVLIHSAAGGVGTQAGRIARQLGAYTIGTVGRQDKVDQLRKEGYNAWIVRDPSTFKQDLMQALDGRPLELIMECIGGKIFRAGFELLAPQGRHIVYGSARYGTVGNRPNYLRLVWQYLTRPKVDPQKLPEQNKSIMGFNLIYLYERSALMHRLLGEIAALDLPPPVVGHTFPFESLEEALRTFQSGRTQGKVVLTV